MVDRHRGPSHSRPSWWCRWSGAPPHQSRLPVRMGGHGADLRPPGSDWLFVKLYCPPDSETELLSGPVRAFARDVAGEGFADWFFIRYSDPRRHIRLRFRGEPARLLADLLPRVTAWATDLIRSGVCERFSIDTYDRELDRFGGSHGLAAAEDFFCADSAAVGDLLASPAIEPLPTARHDSRRVTARIRLEQAATGDLVCGEIGAAA